VHRALTRDPKDRYASTVEMSEALAPWADERSHVIVNRMRAIGSRVPSMAPPTQKISKPPGQSVIPPPMESAAPSDVFAQTQAGDLGLSLGIAPSAYGAPVTSASPSPPMASPRTDVGVSRDATPIVDAPPKRRSPLAIVIPVLAVVVLAGAAWIGRGAFTKHTDTLGQDPPPVVATTPTPPATLSLPTTTDVTPSAAATDLPPTPSVVVPPRVPTARVPTAHGSAVVAPNPPPNPPPTPHTQQPKDLNDLTGKQ
jgi:hypothetical protein